MKYSCFNSIIPLSKKYSLLYNAYSDSFIIFDAQLHDFIINDFEGLREKDFAIYQMLIDSKCYIEDNINEFEHLKQFNDNIVNDNSAFFVMLNPTLACNFKCWYCYENHIPNSKMTPQVKGKVYKLFNNIIKDNTDLESFSLAFFGGEPLLYFKSIVLPFIKIHTKLCEQANIRYSISFTSNGALINESIVSELVKFGDISFQITLDGSEPRHNKVRFFSQGVGSYRLIVNNIKLLLKNGIEVRLRINYTKDNVYSLKDILIDFQDISKSMKDVLIVDFHRVWQDKDDLCDLEEIRDVVNDFVNNKFRVIYSSINEIRESCYADKKNTLIVNYNGDVYKCSAMDFTKENRDGYLDEKGCVVWENSQDYRRSLKLKNKPCHSCRIAPLCGGGCTNYILGKEKTDTEYCLFKYSDQLKDQVILDRFDEIIRNRI